MTFSFTSFNLFDTVSAWDERFGSELLVFVLTLLLAWVLMLCGMSAQTVIVLIVSVFVVLRVRSWSGPPTVVLPQDDMEKLLARLSKESMKGMEGMEGMEEVRSTTVLASIPRSTPQQGMEPQGESA